MVAHTVASTRLLSQRVGKSELEAPGDVVRWMGALQAQDYQQVLWAIGLRTRDANRLAVEAAIDSGEIVRTWPQRGTLHFVAAEDAHWMLELSAARTLARHARRARQLELDGASLARCRQLVESGLGAGNRLSRPCMMQLFESAGIRTTGQRGYHILWRLAQEQVICLGPMEGSQQTFVLLDEWVPSPRRLARTEALAELATRYFRSHGPATVHDFAWWSGLTVADAKVGLEGATSRLTSMLIGARQCWLDADAVDTTGCLDTAHLLPGFDEYLLGYQDRGDVLSKAQAAKIVPGGNGVFRPITVVDGLVTGTWTRKVSGSRVDVRATLFSPHEERALALFSEAAQTYADFLGAPLATKPAEVLTAPAEML